jgi:hypothetical protein
MEDPMPLLGVDLLGQLHRALHVGKQDADLLALALERRLALEDLLGQVLGGVVAGVALRCRCGRVTWSGSWACPRQDMLFLNRNALDLDELVDQLFERIIIERELSLQRLHRDPSNLLQMASDLPHGLEEAHGDTPSSASSFASRCACPVAPISV